jgi:hypothetical protein
VRGGACTPPPSSCRGGCRHGVRGAGCMEHDAPRTSNTASPPPAPDQTARLPVTLLTTAASPAGRLAWARGGKAGPLIRQWLPPPPLAPPAGPCQGTIHEDHLDWETIKKDYEEVDAYEKDRWDALAAAAPHPVAPWGHSCPRTRRRRPGAEIIPPPYLACRLGYERELVRYMSILIRDMDRKIEKNRERAAAESAPRLLKADEQRRLDDIQGRMRGEAPPPRGGRSGPGHASASGSTGAGREGVCSVLLRSAWGVMHSSPGAGHHPHRPPLRPPCCISSPHPSACWCRVARPVRAAGRGGQGG